MNDYELAETIAKEIMVLGNEPNRPCHRIEFKSYDGAGREAPQGGLNRLALTRVIHGVISQDGE